MRTSEQTDKIDEKIALVQSEIEHVTKDKTVEVKGESRSTGEAYGFKSGYATLAALDAAARPALKKHGIVVYQGGGFVQGLGAVLETRLAYNGQWIESFFPIKAGGDAAQKVGGGISFARRWGLCGMLNLVASDAEEADGYKDARKEARGATKGRAPAGIAEALTFIRDSDGTERLEAVARRARGAFPTGNEAAQIEKEIDAWYLAALGAVTGPEHADRLLALRASVAAVKPKGPAVMRAIAEAEARVKGAGA